MSDRMYPERIQNVSAWRGCEYSCIYCNFNKTLSRTSCNDCRTYTPHAHLAVFSKKAQRTFGNEFISLSMTGDLALAPPEIIQMHIDYAKKWADRNFVLHTKNPGAFKQFDIPSNIVLDVTIETDGSIVDYALISKAPLPSDRINAIKELSCRKCITIEPIIDFDADIFLHDIKGIEPEYVYIGYNSNMKVHLPEPSLEKTESSIDELKTFTEVRTKLLREVMN